MNDLWLDWLLLYIQIALLIAMIAPQFVRRRNRNLYAMFIAGTMLILVQGQIWWMLDLFERGQTNITHLLQTIHIDAARRANVYVTFCIVAMFSVFTILNIIRPKVNELPAARPLVIRTRENSIALLLVIVWVSLNALLLLQLRGGIVGLITQPGALVPGQTLFLMALGVGKIPFLRRLAAGLRIRLVDIGLLVSSFVLILLNSRFLSAFILLQIVFIYHYCRRELSRIMLVLPALLLVLIFFGYGLYRDFQNYYDEVSIENFVQFYQVQLADSEILGWFYARNVEGFAGLAGILTYEEWQGPIKHDFGFSNLSLVTQLLPNAVRNDPLVKPISDGFRELYPYNSSIVPPGLEAAYAHAGIVGIVLLGVVLGAAAFWLDRVMLKRRTDKLLLGLISVHAALLVRSTLGNALFFSLGDLAAITIYRLCVAIGQLFGRASPAPTRERGSSLNTTESWRQ